MPEPSDSTIKALFAVSGNRCAFRDCPIPMVNFSGVGNTHTVLGRICHIKGNRPGSERFDKDQSDEDRHAFPNLILLCPHASTP